MIQPHEEIPGEYGHPVWKRNVIAALLLCGVGVLMIASVYLLVWGFVVLAIGVAWAVIACIVGMMQERSDLHREHLPHS